MKSASENSHVESVIDIKVGDQQTQLSYDDAYDLALKLFSWISMQDKLETFNSCLEAPAETSIVLH